MPQAGHSMRQVVATPILALVAVISAACASRNATDTLSGGDGGPPASGTDSAATTSDRMRSGPFKMLVLSTCLGFQHDSIPDGQAMLAMLGQKKDADLPVGAAPGSQFTVTLAQDDLSDFTEENLNNYEILFWMSPTGTVFSSGGANGVNGKLAVQNFMEKRGGAWAGVHAATDFERTGQWTWFQDLVGGQFVSHDSDGTAGTVNWQAAVIAADHPIIRGIPMPHATSWTGTDEWYVIDRDPEELPGFTVLGKLARDQRPVSWVHEISGGGRMFYTIRGHNKTLYADPAFQNHVHQGILWAVHRLK